MWERFEWKCVELLKIDSMEFDMSSFCKRLNKGLNLRSRSDAVILFSESATWNNFGKFCFF